MRSLNPRSNDPNARAVLPLRRRAVPSVPGTAGPTWSGRSEGDNCEKWAKAPPGQPDPGVVRPVGAEEWFGPVGRAPPLPRMLFGGSPAKLALPKCVPPFVGPVVRFSNA